MKWSQFLMILIGVVCASSEPCQWDQYLGNPGRTGYANCGRPDSPEVLWEVALEGEASNPFIVGDKVVVWCNTYCVFPNPPDRAPKPNVAVIDLMTGTLLQQVFGKGDLAEYFPTYVYPVREDVLLGEVRDVLYEIDLVSEECSPISEIPSGYHCLYGCYPVVLPDRIVLPTTPVVCLSKKDYSVLWDLKSSLGALYPVNSEILNIAASDNRLYVIIEVKNNRRIWAVDVTTGEFIWMSNRVAASRIAADGSHVFAGGDIVYALDSETGKTLWKFEIDPAQSRTLAGIRSNIVVGSDAVYFTDQNYVYAVDKNTGEVTWKNPWEEIRFRRTYIVGAEDTIMCSSILDLTAFSAEEGTKLWNIHFPDCLDAARENPCPAVADDIVMVVKRRSYRKNNIHYWGPCTLIAYASNPDVLVRQGDTFFLEGLTEKAINSYKKAARLYGNRGDLSRSYEVLNRIYELENPSETTETVPPESPVTPAAESTQQSPELLPESPESTSETSNLLGSLFAVFSVGAVIVILFLTAMFLIKGRKKQE